MTIFQRFSQISRLSAQWIFPLAMRGAVPAMVCLLMLAAAAVASAQTTYWVSPSGNDTNPGTYSEPFLTFQAAADAAQTPGDTVIFMDGTYPFTGCPTTTSDPAFWDPPSFSTTQGWEYEDTTTGGPTCDEAVELDNQGTASQPITFMAQHRGKAILDGEADWTETDGNWTCPEVANYLGFYNAQYVVVQGFTIQNVCFNAVIDNFKGSATNALSPELTTQGARNITLRWNEFRDIGVHAHSDYGADGFYCGGNAQSSTPGAETGAEGVVIDGNSFHDINPDPSVGTWGDHGLYINCPNVTITNNIFYNIDNGYDIDLSGVEKTGEEGVGDVLIANNTFGPTDPNNESLKDAELYSEIVIDSGSDDPANIVDGVTIQNNIFDKPRQNAIEGNYPNVSDCVIDANIVTNTAGLYCLNGATSCTNGPDPGQGCTQINEPSALLDTGSGVMSAPDSPATGGYDLVSGSVAIDNGDFLAPPDTTAITVYYPTPYLSGFAFGSTDFAKRCRPQGTTGGAYTNSGIDIGAYQYPQTCE